MKKLELNFKKLTKALQSLESVCEKAEPNNRIYIDATIQRFEFTFELFWKTLKVYFQENGLELLYPKEILQEAYADKILVHEELWLQMLFDRNLTSHTYHETLADEIFHRICEKTSGGFKKSISGAVRASHENTRPSPLRSFTHRP